MGHFNPTTHLFQFHWLEQWFCASHGAWFGWPFFIFLLRQFFMTIPKELEEAARLDGASTLRIVWSIFIPLAKPALATVAVLGFVGNWNNFLTPLVYLRDSDLHTLSIAVNRFRGMYGGTS